MSAFAPVPLDRQPPWLRELRQVVTVYPVNPDTGYAAVLCRWCDLTWPLDLAGLEDDPLARALWRLGVIHHGMQHAVDGELRLDAAGEPVEEDFETEGLGWPN